jgi:PAS domain S-box-containing protein
MIRPSTTGTLVSGNEEIFHRIIEHANEIVFTLSPEGVFLFVSPAWTRMLGHPVEEVIGRPFATFVHPDDIARCKRHLQQVFTNAGRGQAVEYRVRHSDGTWRWHRTNGAVMPGDADRPASFVGIARDVTAHRATRARLERSVAEARVRSRVDKALLGRDSEAAVLDALIGAAGIYARGLVSFWSWDKESGHTVIIKRREAAFDSGIVSSMPVGVKASAQKYAVILRYLADEMFWTNDLEHDERVDPGTRRRLLGDGARSYLSVQMKAGSELLGLLFVTSRVNGYFDERKLLLYKTIADLGGAALHTAALHEAARESKQRLSLVVRQCPLPIVEWDPEFRVVSWNPACETVFGHTAAEVIGRSGFGLLVEESDRDSVLAQMAQFQEYGRAHETTRPTLTKSGLTATCRWVSGPRFTRDGAFIGAVSVIEDISARIRADRELQESEQRYRTLSDVTHEGVLIHDQGVIVDANAALARMHGFTPAELLHMTIFDLVAPESRDILKRQILVKGETDYETVSLRRDGSLFPARVVSTPTTFRGVPVRIATVWDLTEEKKSRQALESALRTSQVRYRVSQALAGTETEADVLDALRTCAGLFPGVLMSLFTTEGSPEDPLLIKRWHSADSGLSSPIPIGTRVRSSERPIFRQLFQQPTFCVNDLSVPTAMPPEEREYFQRMGARSCASVAMMTGNQVLGFILGASREAGAFDQDRIAHLETLAEQGAVALRAAQLRATARLSEANFRRVAENMLDMISEVDAEGVYRYVSPSYSRVLGYEAGTLIGQTFFARIHPDDVERVRGLFTAGAATGHGGEAEYRYRHADGRYLWFSTLSKPLFDEKGGFIGALRTARDVTMRRRAEEEVRRLNEELEKRVAARTAQLEAANRELEAFSYSVSHDLRAPLRAINGFSRIINDEWGARLPTEVSQHLRTIRESTTQMALLIEGLLSLSRLTRQPLRVTSIPMAELVAEVAAGIDELRGGREIELVVGELPVCSGDPVLLRQVWTNLIANAVKFTRCRSRARIEIGSMMKDGERVFLVRDNGVGFDMRYADRLFGVFQRLHSSEEYEGSGIGLANVQRIVHRHGGRVWAESAPDQGATFFFTVTG